MSKPNPGTASMDPGAPTLCNIGCPRERGRVCQAWVKPSEGAEWEKHGSDEKPTLAPSYNCVRGCGWHGYIVEGQLVDAPDGITSMHICKSCLQPEIVVIDAAPIRRMVFLAKAFSVPLIAVAAKLGVREYPGPSATPDQIQDWLQELSVRLGQALEIVPTPPAAARRVFDALGGAQSSNQEH